MLPLIGSIELHFSPDPKARQRRLRALHPYQYVGRRFGIIVRVLRLPLQSYPV